MTISLMTGVPGAGKSYSAVELCVVPALKMGRPIVTNLQLNLEEINKDYPNNRIIPFDYTNEQEWKAIPGGALVVLDEVWKIWPSGQRSNAAEPHQREFVAEHRHHVGPVGDRNVSCEMVIISQGSMDIAAWVRSRIDKTYMLEKLDVVGAETRYRVDVYQRWQDTMRPQRKYHISGSFGTYRDEITRLYKSHTKADQQIEGVDISELRLDRQTIWQRPIVIAGMFSPIFLIVSLWVLSDNWSEFYGVEEAQAEHIEQADQGELLEQVPPEVPEVPLQALPVKVDMPSENDIQRVGQWRLRAWITHKDDPRYSIILARGKDRRHISNAECEEDESGEMVCHLEDEIFTAYTGTSVDTWGLVDP